MKKFLAAIIVAVVGFTLVACKDSDKFTVTFESGVEGLDISSQKVSKGDVAEEPSELMIRDGFEFEFWALNGSEYDFSDPVYNNLNLVAKWDGEDIVGVRHTITFDTDGGSIINPVKVLEGTKLAKPANPTKPGQSFVSWQLDGVDYDFETLVTKPFTLKATYKVREVGELHEYYQGRGLENASGDEFRSILKTRIEDGADVKGYGSGLNDPLRNADKHPTVANSVYTIYDGEAMRNDQNGDSGPNKWNKEHVMPQSWYVPSHGNKGDLHNLRIARASINSTRSSLSFAAGSGQWSKVSGGFYPGDEHRGDSARIAMYMMVRFPKTLTMSKVFSGKDTVNMMLKWHFEDPVDDFEIRRNEVLFGIQKNRNPFIDHPEFAEVIWGAYNAKLTTMARFRAMADTTGLLIDLLPTNEVVILDKRNFVI